MNHKKPFEWDDSKLKAAYALAEATLSQEEISSQFGVSLSTLKRWMKVPEFQAKVKEKTDDLDITLKKNRLKIITKEIKRVEARLNLNEDKTSSRDLVALLKFAAEEHGEHIERTDVNLHGEGVIFYIPENNRNKPDPEPTGD